MSKDEKSKTETNGDHGTLHGDVKKPHDKDDEHHKDGVGNGSHNTEGEHDGQKGSNGNKAMRESRFS